MSIISRIAKSAIEAATVNAANRELKDYSKTAKAESKATAKEVKKEVKDLKKQQRKLTNEARSLKKAITKMAKKSKRTDIRLYMILSQIVIDLQKDLNGIKDMKKSHVKDWNEIVRARLDFYRFKFDHPDQNMNLSEVSDPDLIEEKLEKIEKEDEAEEVAEKAEEVAEKIDSVTDAVVNHDYCEGRWGSSNRVTMIASGSYNEYKEAAEKINWKQLAKAAEKIKRTELYYSASSYLLNAPTDEEYSATNPDGYTPDVREAALNLLLVAESQGMYLSFDYCLKVATYKK